jgi:hypothetical protein
MAISHRIFRIASYESASVYALGISSNNTQGKRINKDRTVIKNLMDGAKTRRV